jgi:CHAT domain-containing protein/Tfp pilus assembly protein PilF
MKPADRIVEVNGQASSRLEDVLAYRFDWEQGRDTVFGLRRGAESIQTRVSQGDWGCDFRPDLAEGALSRLASAREALTKPETWQEGQRALEALADEASRAGSREAACWLGIELGKSLVSSGHGKEAQAVLEKWIKAAPAKSYWAFAAALELARACSVAADPDGASKAYAHAGELVKKEGQELRLAGLQNQRLAFELNRGRLSDAKHAAGEALSIRERLVPGSLQAAESLHKMGAVVLGEGDLAAAKEYFLKALAIRERLAPGSMLMARSLNNLGVVQLKQGDLGAARETMQKVLAIQESLEPESLQVATGLMNLGNIDKEQGDLASAKARFLKALAIQERLAPNSPELATTLANLGLLLTDQGELATAKEHLLKALAIQERLAPESVAVAQCLKFLSGVTIRQGDLGAARECAAKAVVLFERLAPKSVYLAEGLNYLSLVLELQGDLATARECLTRALTIKENLAPDSTAVADVINNLGNVALKQGDWAMAREYYLKAKAIYEHEAPDGPAAAAALSNLGTVAFTREDLASAKDYYLKALAMEDRLAPDGPEVARLLMALGMVTYDQGDLASARDLHFKALAIQQRLAPEGLGVADTLGELGKVSLKQGDFGSARASQLKALAIYERLAPGSRALANTFRDLARIEKASGDLARSAELFARAVDALEVQRSRVGGESAKTSFSSITGDFYTDLIAAYLDTKRPPLALETLERSRARTMLEMVSSRYIDLKGEIPAELLVRQQELKAQRRRLSDNLAQAGQKTDPKEIEAWRSELLMLPQKEDVLAEEIRKASPRLAALQYPKPLAFPAMRDTLDHGTLLVAFAVGEKESYLLTLKKSGAKAEGRDLQAVRLKVGRKELENRVMAYRNAVGQPETGAEEWKTTSRELFSLLLGPAAQEIAGSERILLLPDGPLHLLPFATLIPKTPAGRGKTRLDPSLSLGLQRPISVQASLTVYAGLRSGQGPGPLSKGLTWTGFGDPVYPSTEKTGELPGELAHLKTRGFHLGPLPGTRQEIESIARLFGAQAKVHLGQEATKESVLKLPKGMNLVHFACHGLLDPDFPMNSSLALSPSPGMEANADGPLNDGLLQAWEIIQTLRLDSDCVVLSACETGVGKVCGGEGILGLTRAFLYAGARSVVVSLWPISDESTSRFMQAFYKEILAGAPRDQALLRAQATLARQPDTAHPFHWAAFVLVGAGK